jgi:hypothetical protein
MLVKHISTRILTVAATALACANGASATESVFSGYDLLRTLPGTNVGLDLPLPSGGSLELVPLVPVPITSFDFGPGFGVKTVFPTDTIIRRLDAAEGEIGEIDTIPIEMVALQLRSEMPVATDFGPMTLFFTQSETLQSLGTMDIRFDSPAGGKFRSVLDVCVDIRTDSVSGPIVGGLCKQFRLDWTSWLHESSGTPKIPGINYELNGSNTRNDFWIGGIAFHDDGQGSTHVVTVPEPATWAMLIAGFGLVGFAARRRREAVSA